MNRFALNETSYHGAGSISVIPTEMKTRGFKKAFVASDPDLVKFGVTAKVTDLLEKEGIPYTLYSNIKPNQQSKTFKQVLLHLKSQALTVSLQLVVVLVWIHLKLSVSSSQTLSLKM